ncbi:TonB-dependent receptor [Sphingomicrobium sp. XHP0235]|uniref:TonB-dependent receptor n=1 Tax=Sphingomicrobium aquimarinum TaxID=3133971 RepID=UPI0031FF46F4
MTSRFSATLRFSLFAGTAAAVLPTAAIAAPGDSLDIEITDTTIASDDNYDSDPIVITGKRDGYGVDKVKSGTRTDADLNDIPQAISVVTAEQIADQALRSVGDVMRYVPGIAMESGEGHRDAIVVRGNLSTADFFTDGLRDDVQHYRGLYNVERVEVLKGPNALVFGRGGGGGLVNRVLKRPFSDRYAAGGVSIDSEGAGFAEVDINGSLTLAVDGRLNATYERFDDFRGVGGERWGVNPTIGWRVSPETRVDLGYEYAADHRDVDRGIPPRAGGTIADPARAIDGYDDVFFGDRDVNRTDFSKHVVDAAVEHQLSDALSFNAKALYGSYDKIYRNAVPSSAVTDVNGVPSVKISAYEDMTKRENFLVQNNLVARFDTGAIGHTLLVGADYAHQDTEAGRLRGFFDTLPADQVSANGRETFVPLADPIAIPPLAFRGGSGERASETDVDAFGVLVQDQIALGDRIDVIAGVRHDWVDIRVIDLVGGSDLERSDGLWSPRLGLVFKPTDALSLYASWTRSFLPQSGDQFSSLSPTTAALEPERFTNREIGLKWAVLPSLDINVAAYRLDQDNVRAQDPVSLDTVLTGSQRSEGVELEAVGKIGAFSIAGGVAFQDAEITETTDAAPAGRQVPHQPDFEASLWGRYDFSERFGAGLGVSHRSSLFASISNEVIVDPVTTVSGALFANLTDRIALQVNAENLLNEEGINFAHGDNNLHPVEPRRVRGTVRFTF